MAYRGIPVLGSGNSSLIARKLKILISTRRILVLVVFFSFQILLEKVLKKWQLLVESWFWLLFFLFKFYLKKCWKMRISKLLVQSWFWCCLFFPKEFQSGDGEQHKQMAYLFLALLFSWNSSLIERNLMKKCWNMRISKLLVESWFWRCLFSKNNFKRATVNSNSTNRWHTCSWHCFSLENPVWEFLLV